MAPPEVDSQPRFDGADGAEQLLRLLAAAAGAVRRHETVKGQDEARRRHHVRLRRPAAAQQQGRQTPSQALRKLGGLRIRKIGVLIRIGTAGYENFFAKCKLLIVLIDRSTKNTVYQIPASPNPNGLPRGESCQKRRHVESSFVID